MASSLLLYLVLPFWSFHHQRYVLRVNCANKLKQIGLAFKTWALDHADNYPFNVGTNEGGARELCAVGPDGFATNSAAIFQVMSNDLGTPFLLVCPRDTFRSLATNFSNLQPGNVSYRVRLGTNISENPTDVLAVCPIHGSILYCDGSVQVMNHAPPDPPPYSWSEVLALLYVPGALASGFVLLVVGIVLELAARR